MAARSNPYSTINQVRDVFPSCAATSGARWRTASRARRSARGSPISFIAAEINPENATEAFCYTSAWQFRKEVIP